MMQTRRRIRCAEIHGQTPRGMQLSVSPWCAETSTSAEVEEPLPWERETTVRSLLKARTEAGLPTRSNSSNSLTASSRPRLPELELDYSILLSMNSCGAIAYPFSDDVQEALLMSWNG